MYLLHILLVFSSVWGIICLLGALYRRLLLAAGGGRPPLRIVLTLPAETAALESALRSLEALRAVGEKRFSCTAALCLPEGVSLADLPEEYVRTLGLLLDEFADMTLLPSGGWL